MLQDQIRQQQVQTCAILRVNYCWEKRVVQSVKLEMVRWVNADCSLQLLHAVVVAQDLVLQADVYCGCYYYYYPLCCYHGDGGFRCCCDCALSHDGWDGDCYCSGDAQSMTTHRSHWAFQVVTTPCVEKHGRNAVGQRWARSVPFSHGGQPYDGPCLCPPVAVGIWRLPADLFAHHPFGDYANYYRASDGDDHGGDTTRNYHWDIRILECLSWHGLPIDKSSHETASQSWLWVAYRWSSQVAESSRVTCCHYQDHGKPHYCYHCGVTSSSLSSSCD